jgi:hypothetical protein
VWAALIRTRFDKVVRAHGLNAERIVLESGRFRPPEGRQLRLF